MSAASQRPARWLPQQSQQQQQQQQQGQSPHCLAHNEITGHTQFEETTEAVRRVVCTDCGKPCRSDTEQALHTRYTGHTTFVDKTDEAAEMDTEAQMKDARKNEMDVDGCPQHLQGSS
ncbi:MAG: hypothetical protein WDW38_004096 [Sanguina aurantia]